MQQDRSYFLNLLKKHINGQLSSKELIVLDRFLSTLSEEEQEEVFDTIWGDAILEAESAEPVFSNKEKKGALKNILKKDQYHQRNRLLPFVAAAMVLLVCSFIFLRDKVFDSVNDNVESIDLMADKMDVNPGRDRAILLTESGEEIALDDDRVGVIKTGNTFNIVRLESGEIQYKVIEKSSVVERHMVRTPRGGQINFLLPDGSKVWLNTASSLTFSSDMSHKDRIVDMTGEVYFEVAKRSGQRFLVNGDFGKIDVLGTKFNVNTYDRGLSTTALLEGAISLESKSGRVELKPNELATVKLNGQLTKQKRDNIEELTLWKDGYFHFDRANVHSIASQLARWYDIEVKVQSIRTDHEFNGTISRQVKLSKMIEMLDYLGLKCRYIDNKLIIL